ncbi:hypothetical protein R6Z07M_001743 [Ovis aries]
MAFCNIQPRTHWMQTSGSTANCPPGLEYLTQINHLFVCQRFDLEVVSPFETNKTYDVMNNQGQRLYFAEEKSNCFIRHLCGPSRPFTMTIYDNVGCDVITLHKALRWSCCWSNCCLQKLKVEAPPGEIIGYIYQYYHPFLPMFKIKNENKENLMKIRGPCVVSSCLKDLNFNLLSLDEEMIIGNRRRALIRFFTSHESGGGDNLFLPVFLSPTFFACKLAPSGGRASRGRGPRRRRSSQHRAAREAKVPQEGPCARDHAPRPAPRPHHLYFNLSLNSLLFLLPLPAPPLSRSSADEIGPQARRPGSEGTADLAAPWNSCPFTCIHPRRLACGILQPTATQDPPFIPDNWWHPSYTVPTWLVPFTNWTTYMFFSILSLWKVRLLDGICSMGGITRKWNDVLSAVSDADHFEIHFPLDLDAMMKAMVFGVCFLIHLPGNGYQGETVPFSSLIDLQHSKRECVHIFFIFQEVTL